MSCIFSILCRFLFLLQISDYHHLKEQTFEKFYFIAMETPNRYGTYVLKFYLELRELSTCFAGAKMGMRDIVRKHMTAAYDKA